MRHLGFLFCFVAASMVAIACGDDEDGDGKNPTPKGGDAGESGAGTGGEGGTRAGAAGMGGTRAGMSGSGGSTETGGSSGSGGADSGGEGGLGGSGVVGGEGGVGATGGQGGEGGVGVDPIGCASGMRAGLTDATTHVGVAACAGTWTGDVSNGDVLCAAGWHVCLGDEPQLTAVTYTQATAFSGCFAFDAAQDGYVCYPDCSSRVGTIDTAAGLDMGGVGSGCAFQFPGAGSCITGGRIDASENNGIGCNFDASFAGVVCCAD